MALELRYKQDSLGNYMPQYKNDNGEWISFKTKNLPKQGEMIRLVRYIAAVNSQYSVTEAQYAYTNTQQIFFKTELSVMAFLGCAKHYFEENVKEVNF